MPTELLLALTVFAFVTSATPGPNTMMLLASGVNFGVRRSVPHMVGIVVGFGVLLAAAGMGLGAVLTAVPTVHRGLQIASVAYMLWLAWRIANAATPGGGRPAARPMTFLEAAAFQWVNPKAWAIALAGTSTYVVPGRPLFSLALLVGLFVAVNPPIAWAWVAFGARLGRWLEKPGRLRIFNWTMAALLIASLWPVAREWVS